MIRIRLLPPLQGMLKRFRTPCRTSSLKRSLRSQNTSSDRDLSWLPATVKQNWLIKTFIIQARIPVISALVEEGCVRPASRIAIMLKVSCRGEASAGRKTEAFYRAGAAVLIAGRRFERGYAGYLDNGRHGPRQQIVAAFTRRCASHRQWRLTSDFTLNFSMISLRWLNVMKPNLITLGDRTRRVRKT